MPLASTFRRVPRSLAGLGLLSVSLFASQTVRAAQIEFTFGGTVSFSERTIPEPEFCSLLLLALGAVVFARARSAVA
jgi:hypothetical protein